MAKGQFTGDQIRSIRADTRKQREIAADYDTTQQVVSLIKLRQIYAEVPEHPDIPPNSYIVGDALDLMRQLPAGAVKGVITSPPYNKGIMAKSGNSAWVNYNDLAAGYSDYSDNRPAEEYIAWQREILEESLRLVGDDGAVFYQTKFQEQNYLCDHRDAILSGFPLRQVIIWDKSGSFNMGGVEPTILPPRYEVIMLIAGKDWVIPKGETRDAARKWQNLWEIKPEGNDTTGHPASFPLELARRCVLLAGGPVLDPFAGSGTVGLAAYKESVPYYLFDLSTEYKDLFASRLKRVQDEEKAGLFTRRARRQPPPNS